MSCACLIPSLTYDALTGWTMSFKSICTTIGVDGAWAQARQAPQRRTRRHFEIGRILHLKSKIRNGKLDSVRCEFRFAISDFGYFGCEMQDSPNFIFPSRPAH